MQHDFSRVPQVEIPRSVFDRTHAYKTTFDAGYLIPIYVDEVLPGDSFNLNLTAFARLATPIFPVMDNMFMDIHFFYVPTRLIWTNWQPFMGEQADPLDPIDYVIPQILSTTAANGWGELGDYFGLPIIVNAVSANSLPFRAYNLIFNDWYRDQNLQDKIPVDIDDGPDALTDYVLRKRNKRHDYFTSCLPWPQKGPGIEIPVGGLAPVTGIGKETTVWDAVTVSVYETNTSAAQSYTKQMRMDHPSHPADYRFFAKGTDTPYANRPAIFADLSQATPVTINALRQAFQLQRMYERDARSGTRYIEIIKAHFGVMSPDQRVQRPEFLGGSTSPVNITPVPASFTSAGNRPQGSLSGFGTITGRAGFSKSFVEHGYIIGLCSVRADLTYQQGIPKMFLRSTRFDFYWPALAHLGEQPVLNKEIWVQSEPNVVNVAVFGYQERYAEYRYYPSKITGKFRSDASGTLDAWHLSQDFATLPTLGETFIQENPPIDRVIAVPSEPHFIFDSFIKVITARPMPVYSVPGMIDQF